LLSSKAAKIVLLRAGAGTAKPSSLKTMLKDRTAIKFFFYYCTAK
jgi:hypothetical protein